MRLATVTILFVCVLVLGARPVLAAQGEPGSLLSARHQLLVAAAASLAEGVRAKVWPGWEGQPLEILLIAGDREWLIGGSRLPTGFESHVAPMAIGSLMSRSRLFPPGLLATMPVFGPPPTIVIGAPEETALAAGEWLQVLMHEHFHQWQMRNLPYYEAARRLDLAGGDDTGRWMLEYPFPYEEEAIGSAFDDLSRRLGSLLEVTSGLEIAAVGAGVWDRYRQLLAVLEPADARYLEFQVWQEGVARFVELRVAEEAVRSWRPPEALAVLDDFAGFESIAREARERVLEELDTPDLAGNRRLSFYALGAGMALLLDRTEPGWKERYEAPRFSLAPPAAVD